MKGILLLLVSLLGMVAAACVPASSDEVKAIEERLSRVETEVASLREQVGHKSPALLGLGLEPDVQRLEKCLKAVMEAVAYHHDMASQFSVGAFRRPFFPPDRLAFWEACRYSVFEWGR